MLSTAASIRRFILGLYADQNNSSRVRRASNGCLARLSATDRGLQVGSGATRLHPSIVNIDLVFNSDLDCCARAESLPFGDESFSLVVTQETLEHVRGLSAAIEEMYRVLKKGGTLYCQVPFIIGYHPGPTDFWRFSREGIRAMFEEAGFIHEETGISVGPCVGFHRIAVEFGAVLAARVSEALYLPCKGLFAMLLYPIKLLDPVLIEAPQADRIPGGYFVIMRKPTTKFAAADPLGDVAAATYSNLVSS